ncbi:hydrolase 1, exosortase A system-associated [Neptunicella sp.]|uniref:hydrolase 1, exosortase A system-associated n=1 Tax=Neptunicella sp. TaxID=2125986 RepID=UPI003F692760
MESAISFKINQHATLGILHRPESALPTAVLVVVGGPQYRVGSHRQFVQLSRFLANQNIVSFRFDVRGMGDAAGAKQPFEQLDEDIKAATDCLLAQCPEVSKVVIWGLCDAASAALLYAHHDSRISGLVLLNPWLRNDQAMAKTMVKFYYLQRLLSKAFWQKLFSGKVNIGGSLKEAKGMVSSSLQKDQQNTQSYQQGMLVGAQLFNGPVCLILSGNDLTAREFSEQTKAEKKWQSVVKQKWQEHKLPEADHTFSANTHKQQVELITLKFITTYQ